MFPKSLHVQTAVWQAQKAGILPHQDASSARDLFAYQRMALKLQKLAGHLPVATSEQEPSSFAILQLDSMLWTRFAGEARRYVPQVHATSSEDGDVVLVTHGRVVDALVENKVALEDAETVGLIRYYGPADRIERVRAVLTKALDLYAGSPKDLAFRPARNLNVED